MSDFRGNSRGASPLEHPAIAPYEALVGRDALRARSSRVRPRARRGRRSCRSSLLASSASSSGSSASASRELLHVVNATGICCTRISGARRSRAGVRATHGRYRARLLEPRIRLAGGERGSRYERATALLRELTGARRRARRQQLRGRGAAGARYVCAKAREAIVARSQLVEIGGGFRLPDVLARSGATLVEVGATNKTYVDDYETALSPRTALLDALASVELLASKASPHEVDAKELVALGRRAGVPVVEDLRQRRAGRSLRLRFAARANGRRKRLRDGIDLVAFSGDKLLGGPQAGIIVGARR